MIVRNNIVRLTGWLILLLCPALFSGCGNGSSGSLEKRDSGIIHISVDESFQPVIDSQISVYQNRFPKTKIVVHYKPEADCLRDFLVDSIQLIITTRAYSAAEEATIQDSLKLDPKKMIVAYDAIAMIVHPSSADTLMKMMEVKDLLSGRNKSKKFPVFDGAKATSTVRFLIDSVLDGNQLSTRSVAAQSSKEVIDYVSRTPDAVGFIGVSWIGNPEDPDQLTFLEKVKVVQLEHPLLPGKYVTPAQFNIYYGRYPLLRELVYVLKDRNRGPAWGFANFLSGEKGQLIFKRAYLMPALSNFEIRDAEMPN